MFPLRRHLLIIILQKPVCPTLYNPESGPPPRARVHTKTHAARNRQAQAKEATDRMKRHPTKWEKVLANHVSERG